MRRLKSFAPSVLVLLLLIGCATSDVSRSLQKQTLVNRAATVKIINIYQKSNHYRPWEMEDYQTSLGSGAILKDGSIITNAHVVSDSRYTLVVKENDPKRYEAEVRYIGHECDLALLSVKDPAFYEGTTYLDLADTVPDLNSVVTTYGYPMGGNRISITKGVVSRIKIDTYAHQWKSAFLLVQTDAAINPGNSGGPVLQNGRIAGIAFQASGEGENIGYMIPTVIIRHFLEDVADGSYDGFPDLGILWTNLENESLKQYLAIPEGRGGIYVKNILPQSSSEGYLLPGDAIIGVEGVPIADDGSIEFEDGRIMFGYLVDKKQVGDSLSLKVVRKGEVISVAFDLVPTRLRIRNYYQFETKPRYFIYGGLVFQPLSIDYLQMWDEWWNKADPLLLYYFGYHLTDSIAPHREEFVVISKVLPDAANMYVSGITDRVVDRVNGVPITRMEDLPAAFADPVDGFTVITLDGGGAPLILSAAETGASHARLLELYGIPRDRELKQ